ncbi:hypothetical protein N869_01670 [Cellulomonas bogoriensis 69B4 = DSM 16987]|uniref:CBM2 domain-containing protein n=1 Tax=Cellulomonas bogoriensis 69B4 = DSM 16987 TaxID=1386082 RepID=A0A0A0BWW7_9CELL|nr:hypothetical protein N869_01670 [Cellulomonas bogoriensis 69B4 = DSM 16987]
MAEVTVAPTGAALDGWTVDVALPQGAAVTSVWSGQASGSGNALTVRPASWNAQVPGGGSTAFGFQGTGSGEGATVTCTAG